MLAVDRQQVSAIYLFLSTMRQKALIKRVRRSGLPSVVGGSAHRTACGCSIATGITPRFPYRFTLSAWRTEPRGRRFHLPTRLFWRVRSIRERGEVAVGPQHVAPGIATPPLFEPLPEDLAESLRTIPPVPGPTWQWRTTVCCCWRAHTALEVPRPGWTFSVFYGRRCPNIIRAGRILPREPAIGSYPVSRPRISHFGIHASTLPEACQR